MLKSFDQKSYTEVQIRPSFYTFMQILSPSAIKLWPGHRLRRKNINNKGSKISTGPLYYSIVGTVKTVSISIENVSTFSISFHIPSQLRVDYLIIVLSLKAIKECSLQLDTNKYRIGVVSGLRNGYK